MRLCVCRLSTTFQGSTGKTRKDGSLGSEVVVKGSGAETQER